MTEVEGLGHFGGDKGTVTLLTKTMKVNTIVIKLPKLQFESVLV